MSNTAIRKHAFAVVRNNAWKILLVSLLLTIISMLVSGLFSPTLNINTQEINQLVEQADYESILSMYGGSSFPVLTQVLNVVVMPLLTVGVHYWMTLHLSDTGQYNLSEWFATFSRNTKPAFVNVIFYNILATTLSFILTVFWFIIVFILAAFTFLPSIMTDMEGGAFEPSAFSLMSIFLLTILSIFVLIMIRMFVQLYFSLPNFIVFDIGDISFGDVWRLNRTLLKNKMGQAIKLFIWFYLIYFLAALVSMVLVGLFVFLLYAMGEAGLGVFGISVIAIIGGLIFFLLLVVLSILFSCLMETAWATFYRETMKEKIDLLEYEFPHINFRPLTALGMNESAQIDVHAPNSGEF